MSEHSHHISSVKQLASVAFALLVLTILTVVASWAHFPEPWNIIVALIIAVVKAGLVSLFFMNLYWDSKFNSMLLIASIVFFTLLVGITLLDTLFRETVTPAF